MNKAPKTDSSYQKKLSIASIFDSGEGGVVFADFENFFNVYEDENAFYKYNLNSTIYVAAPEDRLKTHVCQHDAHWPTISYQIYGTVRLAWVLMKLNNVVPAIAFKKVPAGTKVKYLDKSDVTKIIDEFMNK